MGGWPRLGCDVPLCCKNLDIRAGSVSASGVTADPSNLCCNLLASGSVLKRKTPGWLRIASRMPSMVSLSRDLRKTLYSREITTEMEPVFERGTWDHSQRRVGVPRHSRNRSVLPPGLEVYRCFGLDRRDHRAQSGHASRQLAAYGVRTTAVARLSDGLGNFSVNRPAASRGNLGTLPASTGLPRDSDSLSLTQSGRPTTVSMSS